MGQSHFLFSASFALGCRAWIRPPRRARAVRCDYRNGGSGAGAETVDGAVETGRADDIAARQRAGIATPGFDYQGRERQNQQKERDAGALCADDRPGPEAGGQIE